MSLWQPSKSQQNHTYFLATDDPWKDPRASCPISFVCKASWDTAFRELLGPHQGSWGNVYLVMKFLRGVRRDVSFPCECVCCWGWNPKHQLLQGRQSTLPLSYSSCPVFHFKDIEMNVFWLRSTRWGYLARMYSTSMFRRDRNKLSSVIDWLAPVWGCIHSGSKSLSDWIFKLQSSSLIEPDLFTDFH